MGQLSKLLQKGTGAGGYKPGRQNGLCPGEVTTALQPPPGFRHGLFHAGFSQIVRAQPVHIHSSHTGVESRFLQQLHEKESGLGVGGGEDGGAGGEATFQSVNKAAVGGPGIGGVLIPGLLREGVGVEPVQKLQVHAQPPKRKLGSVQMQVHKARNNQLISVVPQRIRRVFLRNFRKDALAEPILTDQITVFHTFPGIGPGAVENMPFDNRFVHGIPPFCIL